MAELCREGSPPQVRGKLRIILRVGFLDGITPAGAGKTRRAVFSDCRLWDHPRRCGENWVSSIQLRLLPGSPPQVRGKPRRPRQCRSRRRITPAGAGKTESWIRNVKIVEDHPRRCGENGTAYRSPFSTQGSPPQVRGKLYRAAGIAEKYRITPAGAGKTAQK